MNSKVLIFIAALLISQCAIADTNKESPSTIPFIWQMLDNIKQMTVKIQAH